MNISEKDVLAQADQPVKQYTISNQNGMSVSILNYGCTITNLYVPDKNQKLCDIVLGYQNIADYLDNIYCFGSTVGRFANRIAQGKFSFQGKTYQLEQNEQTNHLHGGSHGFWNRIWQHIPQENALLFELQSADGDAGYPGDLSCRVAFVLTDDNALKISYTAHSNTSAFANLTNHTYFNLTGHQAEQILDHQLQIQAAAITEIDQNLIPTGYLMPVEHTPFDFRKTKKIGQDIQQQHEQLKITSGYDHNFVLDQSADPQIKVFSENSGIEMQIKTSCPGVQFYTGNFLDQRKIEKSGKPCARRSAFCLETQYFPDAINQENFALPIIDKEHPYRSETTFKFTLHE